MVPWRLLHAGALTPHTLPLLAVLTVAAAGTAILLGLALAAFVRRQSRSYLLIVGAFGALFARSAVAGVAVFGYLSPRSHHLLEHGLDIVLVSLVVAAVYVARSATRTPDSNP